MRSARALALAAGVLSTSFGAACAPEAASPEPGSAAGAATFDWGSDCSAGSGTFTDAIPYRATKTIGDIPAGKRNVTILLDSDVDVDVQLIDEATGTEIIAWPNGLLSGPTQACADYEGVEYCYSGYNGLDGRLGKESIEVRGDTNRALVMKAYGYVAGDAAVSYSWQPVPTCNETGSGSFSAYLPRDDVQTIGDIPAGKVNVLVTLRADEDLDIQLFDGAEALVRWPDGRLHGPGEQTLEWKGMRITWSGYNGDGTGLGHELIRVDGRVSATLTMKAFAYRAGTAQVAYEWGRGAGAACGGLTDPPNPPCGDALQCKNTTPGGLALDIPGECHTETWCLDAATAADNCAAVPHIAVPGHWGCEQFTCAWQADGPADGPTPVAIELPLHERTNPQLYLCSDARPCSATPVVVRACTEGDAGCSPSQTATIAWHMVDARDASVHGFSDYRLTPFGGDSLSYVSGPGGQDVWDRAVVARNAQSMELRLDRPVHLTFYDLTVSPGDHVDLYYEGSGFQSASGTSYFYRYADYDPVIDHRALHGEADDVVAALVDLTGRELVPYDLYMMPTDVAVTVGGEGNYSFGGGTITVNYGNPAWIEMNGGAHDLIITEVSHEYTHELFAQITGSFTAYSCLNEGLADAAGNVLGYVSDDNFGTPLQGDSFDGGCTALTELHDKGNCVLYHAKRQGLLDASFVAGLFHPQHHFAFDSCTLTDVTTGNSYLVYLTEAAGASREADVIAALDAAGLPHASSYAAARAALGL